MSSRLFLLDGFALLYRAHFAFIKAPIRTSDGLNTSALYGFDNTLLATLYVTHATPSLSGLTLFNGVGGYALPLGGGAMASIPTQVVVVPEPSTIALLCSGLFGLLAYAWRKRK